MVFEDVLCKFYGNGLRDNSNKWHAILLSHKFILDRDDIIGQYSNLVQTKSYCLEIVEKSYDNLPF